MILRKIYIKLTLSNNDDIISNNLFTFSKLFFVGVVL